MARLAVVPAGAMDAHRFSTVLTPEAYEDLRELMDRGARELEGRVVWNVNSTAKGGGVVELLRPLLGYSRGSGVDARWAVISGSPKFFELTKRLHNHLHGFDGDGLELGEAEHELYERTLAANTVELVEQIRPRDIVILHDPQTAGMVEALSPTTPPSTAPPWPPCCATPTGGTGSVRRRSCACATGSSAPTRWSTTSR